MRQKRMGLLVLVLFIGVPQCLTCIDGLPQLGDHAAL